MKAPQTKFGFTELFLLLTNLHHKLGGSGLS
jgi:hypothetical protein